MPLNVPLLLIPGLNCSGRLFEPQLEALWRHAPLMLCDTHRCDSVTDIATQILACAPPRFAVCGLSLGGFVAQEMLRLAPGRIDRLALLATSARPSSPAEDKAREARLEIARTPGRYIEIPPLHYARNVHPSRQGDDLLRARHRAMTMEVGMEGYFNQQKAIGSRRDARPGLTKIQCPTLIVVGDTDLITPPELSQEMADAIPDSRLVVIPECGHLCTLERPEAVNAALQAWCER